MSAITDFIKAQNEYTAYTGRWPKNAVMALSAAFDLYDAIRERCTGAVGYSFEAVIPDGDTYSMMFRGTRIYPNSFLKDPKILFYEDSPTCMTEPYESEKRNEREG